MAETKKIDVQAMVDELVQNAHKALHAYMSMNQEQIDEIVKAMALAGQADHMRLAKLAVEETGRGIYEDKMTKNIFATEYIYHSIKNEKTVGVISENDYEGYEMVAEPIGVVCGVTPVTNPTSTTLFKSIICTKARNPIIFGFHPNAQKCSVEAAKVVRDAAIKAGAPEYCIQWIEYPSIEATNALMNHPGVATILATGGPGMVKAAYSAGKPALGVGAGNVPCYIEKTANVKRAATDLMLSKTFDNGMICASEQAAIVDKEIAKEFEEFTKANGCYYVNEEEAKKLEEAMYDPVKVAIKPAIVGQSAVKIAKIAGIKVPDDTRILMVPLKGVGLDYPLSHEKLSPVLAYYVVNSVDEGIERAEQMLEFGGLGHSAVVHTNDDAVVKKFETQMRASRILVNAPSSHGAIGDIYNTNMPSLTLGCGSYGNNSTTQNVSTSNLINVKRVAKRRVNMQWFKIPEKIYFEADSTQYLEKMPNIHKAFIVTDPSMVKLGYVNKILYYLRKREDYVHCEIFSEVEPDPSLNTIMKGKEAMDAFQPDVIIALGGGSAMDAAKGMWLFYEYPDSDFQSMAIKFMDIRKRSYKFPKLGKKAKMVCIPTTSGTGSEVTSFAVISDKEINMKYPLADYELTPDIAIIDPEYVYTVPAGITADTGMDVLTHALEAYVSVFASDYTDALAMKAIQLVFEYLPKSYKGDKLAREKMHNASCMAGMAFTNAFLGINHSLAHKLGGEFHIPHGRANAVLLPFVVEYNAQKPTKFMSFPKYETFIADQKYAEVARTLGLPAKTTAEGVKSLVKAIRDLMKELNEPMSLKECGLDEKEYMAIIPDLADKAFGDQCTTANPRMPLVSELEELYKKAYYGK
ncbi:bifunctional acetaldehyde-CoA/alcohol dehydrogenase [Oscillospiraceae bacterium DSM 107454]|uniref:Aldehyde-alcohol dehydrogenase n=2 Tax=Ructibacterium gallinarum TaxID=2779355 RepID=A0A9D5M1L9_9FIRM|nr:bifunctional acetaldehyde-CoA/alcohol dehydrogenase [Ructibacterium gallinarum]